MRKEITFPYPWTWRSLDFVIRFPFFISLSVLLSTSRICCGRQGVGLTLSLFETLTMSSKLDFNLCGGFSLWIPHSYRCCDRHEHSFANWQGWKNYAFGFAHCALWYCFHYLIFWRESSWCKFETQHLQASTDKLHRNISSVLCSWSLLCEPTGVLAIPTQNLRLTVDFSVHLIHSPIWSKIVSYYYDCQFCAIFETIFSSATLQ